MDNKKIKTIEVIRNEEGTEIIGFIINGKEEWASKSEDTKGLFDRLYQTYGNNLEKALQKGSHKIYTMSEFKNQTTVKNLKIYNKCKDEILSGKQIELKHSEYSLGKTLYATQDVGKKRKKQEDSVLINTHPKNKEFKLIAVADGMGGHEGGEIASNMTLKSLINWFENTPISMYNNVEAAKQQLSKELEYVINNIPDKAGTTISLALIGKDKTLIANVGDSRVYTVTKDKLKQETYDDSITNKLIEDGDIPVEELGRYYWRNNIITNVLSKLGYAGANFKIVNNTYDKIIAVSDGVSDCLSKQQLEEIIKNSKAEDLTHNIVEKALTTNSNIEDDVNTLPLIKKIKAKKSIKEDDEYNELYRQKIPGGKDNATVAAYIKR